MLDVTPKVPRHNTSSCLRHVWGKYAFGCKFVEKKGHLVLLKAYRRLIDAGYPISLTCLGYGPVDWLLSAIDDLDLKNHFFDAANTIEASSDSVIFSMILGSRLSSGSVIFFVPTLI